MMRRVFAWTIVAGLVALPALPDDGSSADTGGVIEKVAWLSGCWHGDGGEECWLPPLGGGMIGVNRGPASGDRPPAFEFLRIVEDADTVVFLASPGGRQPATPFRATEVGESRVVFANPEHDFPQRITYWRDGETLRARVEALDGGEWKGFELSWKRAPWR